MDERPKRASTVWIAVQLVLLYCFQVIWIATVAVICIAIFPPEWGFIAAVVGTPVAMAIEFAVLADAQLNDTSPSPGLVENFKSPHYLAGSPVDAAADCSIGCKLQVARCGSCESSGAREKKSLQRISRIGAEYRREAVCPSACIRVIRGSL